MKRPQRSLIFVLRLGFPFERHVTCFGMFLPGQVYRHHLKITGQPQKVRIFGGMSSPARHGPFEPVVLLVDLGGLELHMVTAAGADGDGVAEHLVGLILALNHVNVALQLALFFENRERVFRLEELILSGHVGHALRGQNGCGGD